MISVVIPLFNKQSFIEQAVRSVLKQDFKEFELLVVDDGSTDESYDRVSEIKDSRLKIIRQENSGVSAARNKGINEAKFRWICLLDADDWWSPEFLSSMMQAARTYTGHKIFASGRTLIFSEGKKRYQHEFLPDDGETGTGNYFKVISKYLPLINSSNCMIARDLFFEKGMFRPGQKKHEDHDLWMRLAIDEEVVFVNKPLSFYRKTESDAVSRSVYELNDFKTYINTLQEIRCKLKDNELEHFNQYVKKFLFATYLKNYWHYDKGERKKLLRSFSGLIKGWRQAVLKFSNILPFNLYSVYKSISG